MDGGRAGASSGSGGGGASGGGGVPDAPTQTFVYIGTGDYGKANGGKVRAYTLDESSLALSPIESAAAGTLPSFLVVAPDGQALYAGDESGGAVRAFSIDRASGKLTALNSAEGDGDPVYLNVDRSGKFLFAAYYNQGGIETFAIENDRRVGASKQSLKTGQQAHSFVLSADNAFAFAPHKGSNYIAQFKFDAGTGQLAANTPANVPVSGGPRHLTFHPSKPFAYLMNELDSTMHAFSYDAAKGVLSEIDSKSALPSGSGNSAGADVRVEPNGNFVYASNRNGGSSTLAIFSIDGTSGKLTSVGHTSTHGNTPRQFAIHSEGRIVLVANQDSNNLASFRLDPATGMLTYVATTDVGDKAWSVVFLTVPR
jgi:6-phosphogluconolactonase